MPVGVATPVLLEEMPLDAGRGLQPRPKRLDASIAFEMLSVK
jgi:hypothetical protein